EILFDNAVAFPGLINSHDHLDFNLFPKLGNKIYSNYLEWGNHIHKEYKQEIQEILQIPTLLRFHWGIFKNLLCGVTTVVHHGSKQPVLNSPINVLQNYHSLHSVGFEKLWKLKLNNFFKLRSVCAIHIAEGIDETCRKETGTLVRNN